MNWNAGFAERTAELARTNEALQAEIAERLRVEKALREAGRRKDQFLSTLAHELRNPLVPIRNALEIMRLAGDAPATVESNRALIARQVKQLVRLIDDLLDIARITLGTIRLKTERRRHIPGGYCGRGKLAPIHRCGAAIV